MSYVPWDKVIKEARNRYLMGLIGIMFCNILFSGLIIFFLWIIIYEGRTVVFRLLKINYNGKIGILIKNTDFLFK